MKLKCQISKRYKSETIKRKINFIELSSAYKILKQKEVSIFLQTI